MELYQLVQEERGPKWKKFEDILQVIISLSNDQLRLSALPIMWRVWEVVISQINFLTDQWKFDVFFI